MNLEQEIALGEDLILGTQFFSAELIIDYASKYDPQPFHLSHEGAINTHFGKLCASGWQTASFWMRHNVLFDEALNARLKREGKGQIEFGPGLGINDLRWSAPVFVDSTITYKRKIVGLEPFGKKDEWLKASAIACALNEEGKIVMQFQTPRLIRVEKTNP